MFKKIFENLKLNNLEYREKKLKLEEEFKRKKLEEEKAAEAALKAKNKKYREERLEAQKKETAKRRAKENKEAAKRRARMRASNQKDKEKEKKRIEARQKKLKDSDAANKPNFNLHVKGEYLIHQKRLEKFGKSKWGGAMHYVGVKGGVYYVAESGIRVYVAR